MAKGEANVAVNLFERYNDGGRVVLFTAEDHRGRHLLVAFERQRARPFENAIAAGESPGCEVELNQIVAEVA